ncbi:hypothetical protein C8R45DRAFT_183129 [Mycena sanguinolenta]|nr:hypothetical protein C8R45DRAFT_183129 [Mycena sanguinolenta]
MLPSNIFSLVLTPQPRVLYSLCVFFVAGNFFTIATQPERPPHNAIVKQATVGPFTILYHSAYPPHLQHRASFAWNFYIGRHGEGQNSIMQPEEWSRRGIRVDIIGYTGKWENCTLLKVAPATRVRFTYPTSTTVAQEEVVFPRNPREASIPIQYLE